MPTAQGTAGHGARRVGLPDKLAPQEEAAVFFPDCTGVSVVLLRTSAKNLASKISWLHRPQQHHAVQILEVITLNCHVLSVSLVCVLFVALINHVLWYLFRMIFASQVVNPSRARMHGSFP